MTPDGGFADIMVAPARVVVCVRRGGGGWDCGAGCRIHDPLPTLALQECGHPVASRRRNLERDGHTRCLDCRTLYRDRYNRQRRVSNQHA